MHIDLQRLLNYVLLLLAVSGGIVTGMLAGRMVDLSLGGGEQLLPEATIRQSGMRQLQESDFQVILDRNLFDSQAAGKAERIDLALANIPGKEQPTARTAVDLDLIGTVVAGKDSLALIMVGHKAGVFKLAQELAPGVTLAEVYRNKVVVNDQGNKRELVLKKTKQPLSRVGRQASVNKAGGSGDSAGSGIIPLGGNHWQISRSAAENARSNFNSLLSTARMIPQVENGQTVGFKLLEMKKGSLLEKIGLQVGDILVEINDVVLDSPEKALQVFQQVREANNISLGLIRNGEKQTFEYSFE